MEDLLPAVRDLLEQIPEVFAPALYLSGSPSAAATNARTTPDAKKAMGSQPSGGNKPGSAAITRARAILQAVPELMQSTSLTMLMSPADLDAFPRARGPSPHSGSAAFPAQCG
jgi:hypothetical protein